MAIQASRFLPVQTQLYNNNNNNNNNNNRGSSRNLITGLNQSGRGDNRTEKKDIAGHVSLAMWVPAKTKAYGKKKKKREKKD